MHACTQVRWAPDHARPGSISVRCLPVRVQLRHVALGIDDGGEHHARTGRQLARTRTYTGTVLVPPRTVVTRAPPHHSALLAISRMDELFN